MEEEVWKRTFGVYKTPQELMEVYWKRNQEAPGNIRKDPPIPIVDRYGNDALRSPRPRRK